MRPVPARNPPRMPCRCCSALSRLLPASVTAFSLLRRSTHPTELRYTRPPPTPGERGSPGVGPVMARCARMRAVDRGARPGADIDADPYPLARRAQARRSVSLVTSTPWSEGHPADRSLTGLPLSLVRGDLLFHAQTPNGPSPGGSWFSQPSSFNSCRHGTHRANKWYPGRICARRNHSENV